MSDIFFEDDEDDGNAASAIVKHDKQAACQITIMAIPASDRYGMLTGFAKRILMEAGTVFTASFGGSLCDYVQKHRPAKHISLSTYRKLGSDDERALFDLTTAEIARVGLALQDVKVAQAEIGACWALGLRAAISRELFSAYTIEKILAEKMGSITMVLPGFGPSELAVIARLMTLQAEGKVELRGICEVKNDQVEKFDCKPINDVRNIIARRRNENDFSVSPAVVERMAGMPTAVTGVRPTAADILFIHITDNMMFQRNIPPIIDAVKAKKAVPAVLVYNGRAIDVYSEKLTRNKIYRFNPKADWSDQVMLRRLSLQVAARMEVATQDVSGLRTWTPLFSSQDKAVVNGSLKKLLVFQSAMNLMHGWVKPRSIYLTQSPDTNPYAYLAMTSSKGQCNFYYSFSGLLDEDTRSLPFVAPAKLLAYGEQDQTIVSARNEKAGEAVNIVGTPSYDVMHSLDMDKAKQDLKKDLDLPKSGKVVVLMTSRRNPEIEDRWLARFLRWANEEGLTCILVKGRRAGTKDYTTLESMSKVKKWNNVRFIYHDRINAIAGGDIVVTDLAEAAAEAVLLDKVMVHVRLEGTLEGTSELAKGIGYEVKSEHDLKDIVSGILMDDDFLSDEMIENRENFKKWVNGDNDGKASKRVAGFLLGEAADDPDYENPFVEKFVLSKSSITAQDIVKPAKFNF